MTDPVIYLDTHVVAWMYGGDLGPVPVSVRSIIDAGDLVVSPTVALELQYLYESGRASQPVDPVLTALEREVGLRVCDVPFVQVVRAAFAESWTRDPFDRLIVAQARLREAPLLTKDREIHQHYERAVWE